MSEKFISYDNLKQYDELLDKELNNIKDTVDKGFTFNVKYAESDEIGGAAIKAVNDETGENIAEHFDNIENDVALNKTTLGYQKKNLFKNTMSSQTINGIGFVCNSDGTVKVNGTATANTSLYMDFKIPYGKKVSLTGCPSGGSNSTYALLLINSDFSQYVTDVGDGVNFNLSDSSKSSGRLRIDIMSGVTVTNLIFKPMVRYADITDDTYEPYVDDVDTRITDNKNDIAINKTTLGYQKKNLMKLAYAPGYTHTNNAKSVTWTFNSDYSLSMVVTTKLTSGVALEHSRITLQPGTYIYSVEGYSTPSITHTQLYKMNADGSSTFISNLLAIENTITVTEETTYSFRAYRNAAVTVGVTEKIYPMLRNADITDDTFEPYVDDVDTRIIDNKNDIAINETTLGYQRKNLLKNRGTTQTINGVTFTINEDKTVTANGTATSNATLHLSDSVKLNVGTKYILSGCPEGGGLSTYRLYGLSNGYGWYDNGSDEGEGKLFTATESESYTYRIVIYSGITVNNLVFKPMIRLADITDDTYEPYVESVDERLQNFVKSGSGAKSGLVPAPSTTAGTTKYLREDGTWQVPPDNNTHYASKNVVGSATATSNTTTALTNGNVYLNSVENGVVTSTHKISGSGATTVTTDKTGNIIIESTDTNTVGKTIDGNYKTSFRTQTKGNSDAGDYLSNIRNDTASVSGAPQYGSGLAFGRGGTHGYLYTNYSNAEAYIGGGNADCLKWVSKISLDGHTHNYLPLSGGTMDTGSTITIPGSSGRALVLKEGGLKITLPTNGAASATGITYANSSGTELANIAGYYDENQALKYFYMGTASSPLLKVDGSGNGTFKGSCTATSFVGNASSATKLATARTLEGVSFNGTAATSHFAVCNTAAATAAKEATLTDFNLVVGARVILVFTNGNSANEITLNISSTGAKPVYYANAKMTNRTLSIQAGVGYEFIYAGDIWVYCGNALSTEQSNTTTNASYRLLLSKTADNNVDRGGTKKSANFTANPSTGVLTAKSFKSSGGTTPLATGSVTAANFNGSTGSPKTLTITVSNLSYYSTLYLELGNVSEGYITGSIPINYLLNSTSNSIYLQASLAEAETDWDTCWCKVTASGNNIYINSPQCTSVNYYSFFTNALTYKVFKI